MYRQRIRIEKDCRPPKLCRAMKIIERWSFYAFKLLTSLLNKCDVICIEYFAFVANFRYKSSVSSTCHNKIKIPYTFRMYLNNKQYYSNKESTAFTSWQCHAVEHHFSLNKKKTLDRQYCGNFVYL